MTHFTALLCSLPERQPPAAEPLGHAAAVPAQSPVAAVVSKFTPRAERRAPTGPAAGPCARTPAPAGRAPRGAPRGPARRPPETRPGRPGGAFTSAPGAATGPRPPGSPAARPPRAWAAPHRPRASPAFSILPDISGLRRRPRPPLIGPAPGRCGATGRRGRRSPRPWLAAPQTRAGMAGSAGRGLCARPAAPQPARGRRRSRRQPPPLRLLRSRRRRRRRRFPGPASRPQRRAAAARPPASAAARAPPAGQLPRRRELSAPCRPGVSKPGRGTHPLDNHPPPQPRLHLGLSVPCPRGASKPRPGVGHHPRLSILCRGTRVSSSKPESDPNQDSACPAG